MINAGARRVLKSAAVAGGAAAVGSSASEAKSEVITENDEFAVPEPDKHRVIFAPDKNDGPGMQLSLNRKQLSKIALYEIKDAPKDIMSEMVLSLGEDLARDPSVQRAVYKKFGVAMDTIKDSEKEGEPEETEEDAEESLADQLAYLKDELESQQTLNEQLVYHNDKLCEEKIKLKRTLSSKQIELERAKRKRRLLELKLRTLGGDAKFLVQDENVQAPQPQDEPKDEDWSLSQIVVKALAVAAVVILMAVVKKKGVVTVAATTATGAWGWMRRRMHM